MTANALYPISTQDGKAIPLDIIQPLSLVCFDIPTVPGDITIPAGFEIVYLFATRNCVLRFSATDLPSALVPGTEYADAFFIPSNTIFSVKATPGSCSILGLEVSAGKLYMSSHRQWAALLQTTQSTIG